MQLQLINHKNVYNVYIEKKLSVALVAILLLPTVKFCIVQSIPGLYLYNWQANIIIAVIIFLLSLPTISTIIRRNGFKLVIIFSSLTAYIFINYLFYPDNRANINAHLFDIYCISFLCLSLSLSLHNYKLFLDYLHRASYVMVSSGLFMLIATSVIGVVGVANSEYNMSLSYYMVVPTITLMLMYYQTRKLNNMIFFSIGFLVILAMGSRGSLLCIVTFFILYNVKYRKYTYKRVLIDASYLMVGLIIIFNRNKIYNWLYNVLLQYNINSRTLYYLIQGKITALSNRDAIMYEITEIIYENPITGIGFLGDLRSHNIILETLLFNGIFMGSIILIIFVYISIKSLLFKSNKELSYLIIIFFSYAIPDAMLNLTVWGKDMFWIYLGFCIASYRKYESCYD